jgi:hypothetical protein
MSKRFFYVYENPDYLDELEIEEAMAEMPTEPMPTDDELERMAYFYQQRAKERENA